MSWVAAAWHLMDFFGPALGLGVLAPLLAKLMWRRALKPVGWLRLGIGVTAACSLTLLGGLVVFGRDGKMATYAAVLLTSALVLWWLGFSRGRR